jgi:hypothetical protein
MKKILFVLSLLIATAVVASSGVLTGCSNQSVEIFTSAPKNPNTPEEVTAAWYFLLNKGDYLSAMKLYFGADEAYKQSTAAGLSKEQMLEIDNKLSTWMEQMSAGGGATLRDKVLKQITIKNVDIVSHRAQVSGTLYFTGGVTYDITGATLLTYDNKWHVR